MPFSLLELLIFADHNYAITTRSDRVLIEDRLIFFPHLRYKRSETIEACYAVVLIGSREEIIWMFAAKCFAFAVFASNYTVLLSKVDMK